MLLRDLVLNERVFTVRPRAYPRFGVQLGAFCAIEASTDRAIHIGQGVVGHHVTLKGPISLASGVKIRTTAAWIGSTLGDNTKLLYGGSRSQ